MDFEKENEPEVESQVGESIEPSVDEGGAVEEEYMPNFTYTHHDQEHEFPEWVREAIKSKDQEEEIRNWVTSSAGLPELKDKLGKRTERNQGLEEHLINVTGGLADLKTLRDQGDLGAVFKRLGIKEQDFMKYAVSLAEEEELPDDQKSYLKERRDFEAQQKQFNTDRQQFQTSQFNNKVENDYRRLMGTLNTGKYEDLNKAMASRGINMAEEVCITGQNHELASGTVPPIEDCIDRVFDKFSHLLDLEKLKLTPPPQQPTIPSVRGTNTTAVKPKVKSILDIERAYSALADGS